MNPELLFQLLDYLEVRNVDRIDLLTNGSLFNDDIIDSLKRYLRNFNAYNCLLKD